MGTPQRCPTMAVISLTMTDLICLRAHPTKMEPIRRQTDHLLHRLSVLIATRGGAVSAIDPGDEAEELRVDSSVYAPNVVSL